LEWLLYNRILDFYSDSISCHQFGFWNNKSTLQQLLLYFDDLCTDRKQTDSIDLDFSKAFNSVSHAQLLMKLRSAGIIGGVWSWLRSYLSGCSQCVLVNNCLSQPLPVKSGVPQGSTCLSYAQVFLVSWAAWHTTVCLDHVCENECLYNSTTLILSISLYPVAAFWGWNVWYNHNSLHLIQWKLYTLTPHIDS